LKKLSLAAIIILFLSINIYSQNVVDSLQFIKIYPDKNVLSSNFNKQLNTYLLLSALKYDNEFGKFRLSLNENYKSSYTRAGISSTREEHFLRLSTSYRLTSKFSLGILTNNNILSDSRQIDFNQASQTNAAFFTMYNPINRIYISPFFGYSYNEQTKENDYGYLYGTEALIDNILLSDNTLYSELKFRHEDIAPRKNSMQYYNFILTNQLSGNTGNMINASYSRNRKDFYFAADTIVANEFNLRNNIQSRIETDYFLQDRLVTKSFFDLIDLDLTGRFLWRTIDRDTRYRSLAENTSSIFDTRINELRVELESIATYNSDFFNGNLRLSYSERDEKHITKNFEGVNQLLFEERSDLEGRKNNKAMRATAAFTGSFNFSRSDIVTVSLYQNKLKYDTPSAQNFDDRDEMLSIARIKYLKKLTPFFDFFVNTDATISQTVYIFSEKSSNNNINRILRLKTGGYYHGKKFSSLNSFEVSANYTVYSFEDINPNYQSFSFRQFTARDSSSIQFNRRLSFSTFGYIKLSEQGSLKWASFSTNPTRYLQEIYSESKFTVNYETLWFSLGTRVFSLNTYNYKVAKKVIDSKFLSIAPLTEITVAVRDSLYLRVYGWYEFISLSEGQNKQEANLSIQMNWNF